MTRIVPATDYVLCLINAINRINMKYFIIFMCTENVIFKIKMALSNGQSDNFW